jgi:hypothetical protein
MLRRRSDTEGPNEQFQADSPGVSASGPDLAGPRASSAPFGWALYDFVADSFG